MNENLLYKETLTSLRTESLFVILTLFFTFLTVYSYDLELNIFLIIFLFFLAFLFLFYSLNYYKLTILLTPSILYLKMGIFTKQIKINEVSSLKKDEISLWRVGGAGIHATKIQENWRIFFNFLEYPRLVIHKETGFYKEIAFSTKKLEIIQEKVLNLLIDSEKTA